MPTYSKSDLKNEIKHKLEGEGRKVYKKDLDYIVDSVFDLIQEHVSNSDVIIINGFGRFSTSQVKSFEGRDPRNEEPADVKKYKRVTFRTGKEFKRMVNGEERYEE